MKNLEIIPVVYSCDDNYAAYLGVSIKSLIENSTFSHQYKIYILDGGISEVNKKRIKSLEKSNITIEFVDVSPIMDKFDLSLFKLSLHFTIATYYRFFLPQLFPNFSKLCYIDCDTVVLKDIALLYETDIKGYYLGVTRDIENIKSCNQNKEYKKYYYNTLDMQNHLDYFNAGVLVCNIEKMKSDNLTEQLIKTLEKIGNPRYVDQCILNSVCEGKVKFISQNWNFTWHTIFDKNYQQYVQSPFLEAYEKAAQDPYILHFTGCGLKPWLNPSLENSEYFWTYARLTPFYEEILFRHTVNSQPTTITQTGKSVTADDKVNMLRLRIKKAFYSYLAKLTWGGLHKKYKEKRKKYKEQIKKHKKTSLRKWKFRLIKYRILSILTFGKLHKKFSAKKKEAKAILGIKKK